eukprot:785113-Amphidinium_carterae.1
MVLGKASIWLALEHFGRHSIFVKVSASKRGKASSVVSALGAPIRGATANTYWKTAPSKKFIWITT